MRVVADVDVFLASSPYARYRPIAVNSMPCNDDPPELLDVNMHELTRLGFCSSQLAL